MATIRLQSMPPTTAEGILAVLNQEIWLSNKEPIDKTRMLMINVWVTEISIVIYCKPDDPTNVV